MLGATPRIGETLHQILIEIISAPCSVRVRSVEAPSRDMLPSHKVQDLFIMLQK